MQKLVIVVPSYNCEKWIGKTIDSIKKQTYENFICILVDDISTDNTYETMKTLTSEDPRFICILNKQKKYALKNFVDCFRNYSKDPEDILIQIDGDDWLYDDSALETVVEKYKSTNCLMTYGSFIEYPSGVTHDYYLKPYSKEVVKNNAFREVPWKASHLRTFKAKLWNRIKDHDLIDEETGLHYEVTCDLALMFPMLEMAGERSEHIEKILYCYNKTNPLSDMYVKEKEQIRLANKIRNKKKYERESL